MDELVALVVSIFSGVIVSLVILWCYSARRFDADRRANLLRSLDSGGQISAPNNKDFAVSAFCQYREPGRCGRYRQGEAPRARRPQRGGKPTTFVVREDSITLAFGILLDEPARTDTLGHISWTSARASMRERTPSVRLA